MSQLEHCGFVGDVTALHLLNLSVLGNDTLPQYIAAGRCIARKRSAEIHSHASHVRRHRLAAAGLPAHH